MAGKVFREINRDRITSPEQLDRYIRISTPGVWLVLGTLILLLTGFCVWGCLGKLETVQTVSGLVRDGEMTVSLEEDDVQAGMEVRMDGKAVGIVSAAGEEDGAWIAQLDLYGIPDGRYVLDIVVESIRPVHFILGRS